MAAKATLFVSSICIGVLLGIAGIAQPPASIPTMDMSNTDMGGNNSIAGTVITPDGSIAQRRVVIRLRSVTRGERSATTDEHGNYAFRGLPSGDYTIAVDREKEYEPTSANVTIIQLRGMPAQTYLLDIHLAPRRDPSAAKPAVVNASFANVPPKAMSLYKDAGRSAAAGKSKEAIEGFQAAIAAYPKFAQAYNDLGVQYMKSGDIVKADEAFVNAIQIDPAYYNALLNHGMANFMVRQYKDAEIILRKAVSIKDDGAVAHYFLGQTLANLSNFDEAEKELTKALKLNAPEVKEAYRVLAVIHASKGNKKLAAEDLQAYLKLAPKAQDASHLQDLIKQYQADK